MKSDRTAAAKVCLECRISDARRDTQHKLTHDLTRRFGIYKAAWRGGMVLFAGQFAPTSRTCSGCGSYQSEFSLKIRQWTCPACGAVHDRDENAANNIVAFATGAAPGNCGGETPEVMRVEGDTDPIPKGAIPRTDRGLDEARTESLKPSTILPSEARKPREEQ